MINQPFKTGRQIVRGITVILSILLAGCGGPSLAPDPSLIQIQTPKLVIYDTDMAHEDVFSALFLLSHPNVDVRAITVAGTGEVHCGPGVEHALGLAAMTGHEDIPVACGREKPLSGDHAFPAEWRKGADQGYGVDMPKGGSPSDLGAADLIIDLVQNSEEAITIVAVGPLTNIAEAIQKDPGIAGFIKEIYIMGGAVNVGGNVGISGVGIDNQYAEWNIYIDPAAANIVFDSGIPVVLVPLDATNHVPITRRFYNALGDHLNTPSAVLVHDILTANLGFVDSGGFQFWDSLTSAIFTDEGIGTYEEFPLMVVEQEGPESGHTKPDPNGATIKVATTADRNKFEQVFLTVLNWEE